MFKIEVWKNIIVPKCLRVPQDEPSRNTSDWHTTGLKAFL